MLFSTFLNRVVGLDVQIIEEELQESETL